MSSSKYFLGCSFNFLVAFSKLMACQEAAICECSVWIYSELAPDNSVVILCCCFFLHSCGLHNQIRSVVCSRKSNCGNYQHQFFIAATAKHSHFAMDMDPFSHLSHFPSYKSSEIHLKNSFQEQTSNHKVIPTQPTPHSHLWPLILQKPALGQWSRYPKWESTHLWPKLSFHVDSVSWQPQGQREP